MFDRCGPCKAVDVIAVLCSVSFRPCIALLHHCRKYFPSQKVEITGLMLRTSSLLQITNLCKDESACLRTASLQIPGNGIAQFTCDLLRLLSRFGISTFNDILFQCRATSSTQNALQTCHGLALRCLENKLRSFDVLPVFSGPRGHTKHHLLSPLFLFSTCTLSKVFNIENIFSIDPCFALACLVKTTR